MTENKLTVVPYIKFSANQTPYIEGTQCNACHTIFLGDRQTCSKCGARKKMNKIICSSTGKLYSYSIVYRSFPGIKVPYISAVVDLDDGTTIKGNLIGIDPDPKKIKFDMPVKVVFDDALGRQDKDGKSYISYFFQPLSNN